MNTKRKKRNAKIGARITFCPLLCVLLSIGLFSGSLALAQPNEFQPPAAPVVWGDVTRDNTVDLADLVQLGQSWGSEENEFGWENASVLEHMQNHWRETVPATVSQIGWENRPTSATITGFVAKAAKVVGADYTKQIIENPELPIAVGFGVTFPTKQGGPIIGLPVYSTPQGLKPVRQQFRQLEGAYNDSSAFYDFPIEASESQLQYTRSYEEEQEFRGVDLSVEARYSIYSASLANSNKREQYREGRSHKLLYKQTKSFGWAFLPPESRVISPKFITEREAGGNGVLEKYGTHYVYAEHRVGSLFIELDFTTSNERDRNETNTTIKGAVAAPTFALNIKAAISAVKQKVKNVTAVHVRIVKRGGSPNLMLSDGRSWDAVANNLDADSENLQDEVSKLIAAWNADLTFGNANVDNFYCRPITDFYSTTPVLPWDKGKNLRDWYKRYAELHDASLDLFGILNPAGTDYSFAFEHYKLARPENDNPVPDGSATWLEYMKAKRDTLKILRDEMLIIGRKLYNSKETDTSIGFDPLDPNFQVPEIRFPRFQPIFDFSDTSTQLPCRNASGFSFAFVNGRIKGQDFPDSGAKYQWQAIKVKDPFFCQSASGVQFNNPINLQLNFEDPSLTKFSFQTRFNSANGDCCSKLEEWQSGKGEGFAIAIIRIDTKPDRIIGYGCGTNLCDDLPLDGFTVGEKPGFIQ